MAVALALAVSFNLCTMAICCLRESPGPVGAATAPLLAGGKGPLSVRGIKVMMISSLPTSQLHLQCSQQRHFQLQRGNTGKFKLCLLQNTLMPSIRYQTATTLLLLARRTCLQLHTKLLRRACEYVPTLLLSRWS